ncbi:MAG TPA: SH3 domain-containing protein [Candidatus Avipropionibacterium avicola]|uniref:SH3 domain-containing protein n=1 Tax=Candidatus Avipropionibacterium avicola TaxID=2840701 RepID=A0A9D1KN56_9ACTN|nr:SH3 domain-containing protein [Candidatus Avipropionibacterium avicola]
MKISQWTRAAMTAVVAAGLAVGSVAAASPAHAAGGYKGKVIAKKGLVIRSAPSSHAKATGSLEKGDKISLDCKANGPKVDGNGMWYELSNGKGWVTARYVDNIGAAPKLCPVADTEFGVGKTKSGVNMRSGPTTDDSIRGALPKGTKVTVRCYVKSEKVGSHQLWYLLDNGSWVSAANVKRLDVPASNWVRCT